MTKNLERYIHLRGEGAFSDSIKTLTGETTLAGQLFLLDGYAMLYRAHFAFIKKPLVNSRGETTSAVFGLALQLARLLEECRPEYMAFILDPSGPTFRHELFPAYKATREKMPEDMREQIPWARRFVEEALRIPVIEREGYEADDVIGTLARKAARSGLGTVIVSGDKDFYQLIDKKTRLYNQRPKGEGAEWVGLENAAERLGVPPEKVVDLLSLMGDSADNVPGVRGIGKVGAGKLLSNYSSLDQIYEHLEEITPEGVRKKLEEGRDDAYLSRELVIIRIDVPVSLDIDRVRLKEPDYEVMEELFERLEFRKLRERFGLEKKPDMEKKPEVEKKNYMTAGKRYVLVDSIEMLEQVVEEIRRADMFCVDVETTSLDPVSADLVGISLSYEPDRGYYIPVAHEEGPNVSLDKVREVLGPVLADPDRPTVGQNIKYDMIVLERHGVEVRGIAGDPMIASYLLDPGRRSHGLDALAESVLGYRMISYEDVVGKKGKEQKLFSQVPVREACTYACEDADVTLIVDSRLSERLAPEEELSELYRNVELPLIPVLARMEMNGVAVDVPYLEKMSGRMSEKLSLLEKKVYELAGREFNVNSTKQLQQVLFEELGIKPGRKTKTGYSTDSTVLSQLAGEHELPGVILGLRETAKLKSTYVDALPRQVNPRTGRIHTSFNQMVTATGRLSSSNPNLQNIPVRTEEGRLIRKGFIPGGGDRVLLSADYSQIELRILAHMAGDQAMIEAFTRGVDIHTETAARVFGLDPDEVSSEQRGRAKTINFGVLYGMGAHRLSRELKIPFKAAKEFIDSYFDRFPLVREYIDRQIAQARAQGWVSTILGRRRRLPEITSSNRMQREHAERMALNTPIQGSAADLIKVAMIEVDKKLDMD
ncbi:MAG: DNA polymerase I, partial [Gemmatimonadota bacterium]|nr:DNA polymerase I [Gemmatimonadota bacterium]